jgi:methylamine utilization protein MauE
VIAVNLSGRIDLLRITVILALLAGFALSPKLWLSSRFYPLTPVWSFLKPIPSPADAVVFLTLIALLITVAIVPRRELFIAAFLLLAWLALQDQSRWQPWFYQYVLMLLAIALALRDHPEPALNTCCLIVAATYFWSGLAKLNPNFTGDIFPWLLQPIVRAPARYLGFLAPLLESTTGIGLLFPRSRPAALVFAIAMHLFILISIGPLGLRFNTVVWPWNLAMIAFLLILFVRQPAPREILWSRTFAFHNLVLIVFALMPALTYFNLWDHYLSSALYSGNRSVGVLYLTDDVFERVPDTIADYVYEAGPNRGQLDIDDWSRGELNVPAYPEIRIYKNVARRICDYATGAPGVELIIQTKLAFINSHRRLVYYCSALW